MTVRILLRVLRPEHFLFLLRGVNHHLRDPGSSPQTPRSRAAAWSAGGGVARWGNLEEGGGGARLRQEAATLEQRGSGLRQGGGAGEGASKHVGDMWGGRRGEMRGGQTLPWRGGRGEEEGEGTETSAGRVNDAHAGVKVSVQTDDTSDDQSDRSCQAYKNTYLLEPRRHGYAIMSNV